MTRLTKESAIKLQRILSKRFGRDLSDEELEQAYDALIGFAVALVELSEPPPVTNPPSRVNKNRTKLPLANEEKSILQYV